VDLLYNKLYNKYTAIHNRSYKWSLGLKRSGNYATRYMQEFHEELAAKNKEMERLDAAASRQSPGDAADALGPARLALLHNKWRTVWRLSLDRKKLLQDTLDHLIEVRHARLLVRLDQRCVQDFPLAGGGQNRRAEGRQRGFCCGEGQQLAPHQLGDWRSVVSSLSRVRAEP